MRTIYETFYTLGGKVLVIGNQGESGATQVVIQCETAMGAYGAESANLVITDAGGTTYPGEITLEDGVVTWTVYARDTQEAGKGSVRLDLLDDDGLIMTSAEARTMVNKTNVTSAALTAIIDPTEYDSFCTMDHPKDSCFIYRGVRYQALRFIAMGERIVTSGTGKNCDVLSVGDELFNLASDLYYEELSIESMSVSPNQAEMGSTVGSVSVAYELSKVPDGLTLDNVAQTPAKSGTINLTGQTITENKTFILEASDSGSHSHPAATVTRTGTLSFLNRAFYGAASAPGEVNSAFLLGLANKPLASGKARTFSVNADSGQYIWYAVPKRFGACTFRVGGFVGGFEAAQTVSVTNASGYTEDYYVYRSTNAGLGSPEIVVT